MNPPKAPANQPTGNIPMRPQQDPAFTPDVPDAAFGFADEPAKTNYKPVQNAPRPADVPAVSPRPPVAPVPAPPLLQPIAPPPSSPVPAAALPPQNAPAAPNPFATATAQAAPATFSPTPVTHLPDDIAARIAETPMRNSSDINKMVTGRGNSKLKSFLSFLAFTAAIFVAAFLINQYVFQSYYVEGTSMTPTLQNNDRLIISKVERTLANVQGKPYIPERGQIVVLDSSIVGLNGQKEQLIKRVIGLPGDKIHIKDGVVTLTNSQYPDGANITLQLGLGNLKATYSDTTIDLTVPKNQVYVMGDNREQGGSYDSRSFGPIDGDKIQGRLWARILPFDKAQIF